MFSVCFLILPDLYSECGSGSTPGLQTFLEQLSFLLSIIQAQLVSSLLEIYGVVKKTYRGRTLGRYIDIEVISQ
jgi:hypothetical protein